MRAIHYVLFPAAALTALLVAGPGLAHERERGERGERESREHESRGRGEGRGRGSSARGVTPLSTPAGALYAKECGACHLAYPPTMLPAASWRRTMAGLERHFGQNAELDAPTAAELERWLVENAGEAGGRGSRRAAPAGDAPRRISELPWFLGKHDEVDPRAISRPSIRSWANCGACHGGAREWDFDEDRVKIPR